MEEIKNSLQGLRTSLAVQWLGFRLPVQGVQVQFLVGELRSHISPGQKANTLKKKKNSRDFPGGPVVKNSPSIARGMSSIPGQGAKISHTLQPKKQKQYCNKFNKDF